MNVNIRCLARTPSELPPSGIGLIPYSPALGRLAHTLKRVHVLLDTEGESEAQVLLGAGVERVFIGDEAIRDDQLLGRLCARFGTARVGLHLRARRQPVSWAFDTESNADFSVVTPSLCVPSWEVLLSDGQVPGLILEDVLQRAVQQGVAAAVVLRIDMQDDADLSICAGLVESFGDLIWFSPLDAQRPALADWIEFGQVRQLALPLPLYHQRGEWMPVSGAVS